ncbi:uncharacterized protein LOC131875779 [Cryptomeria japonica]|uniref:uncharacterized protein LOC131875779 n=1 Tax=Cryptomeria japonica TaxID=3369 RepID=UPI0027DA306A|nr:uncharacterized protein LOC131875779 [Cryptomeria japonica]
MVSPKTPLVQTEFDGFVQNVCQAGGEIIHDHLGKTVPGYTGNLKNHTVTQAKVMALLWGLRFATSIGIKQLEIEGDSQIIMEMVSGRYTAGWKVDSILRDFMMLLANLDGFTIQHIFKEGNAATDSMVVVGML